MSNVQMFNVHHMAFLEPHGVIILIPQKKSKFYICILISDSILNLETNDTKIKKTSDENWTLNLIDLASELH